MFNFFCEIKNKIGLKEDVLSDYNIVNISGRLLYAEGHKGIISLADKCIVFKTKNHNISIEGSGLFLVELNENTLYVQGKIDRVERLNA